MKRQTPLPNNLRDRLLLAQVQGDGLPEPQREWRVVPERRWRFDFAWPVHRVALEIEGGVFTRGRHVRGAGFLADMEKYNAAALAGWKVLRVTPQQVKDGTALKLIGQAIREEQP